MNSTNIFKPILFSTEMVQAILAGRKTQTRRVIKPIPRISQTVERMVEIIKDGILRIDDEIFPINPGDILWIRESWKVAAWNPEEDKMSFYYKASPGENFPMIQYNDSDRCDDLHVKTIVELDRLEVGEIDNEECTVTYNFPAGDNPLKWNPSLFMPKEAARIFLKVSNVRCERLQDISHTDALLEGITGRIGGSPPYNYSFQVPKTANLFQTAQQAFNFLWDSINAKKHPWESNPWVWVYDFERIEKPADFNL